MGVLSFMLLHADQGVVISGSKDYMDTRSHLARGDTHLPSQLCTDLSCHFLLGT